MAHRSVARNACYRRVQHSCAARRRRPHPDRANRKRNRGGSALSDLSPAFSRKGPRRAAYALPTLFTAGNIFLGYLSIVRTMHGAMIFGSNPGLAAQDFDMAASTIGLAVILDGFDG